MSDKDEKARRKQMLHAVRDDARQKKRDSLPVPAPVLKALFNYVDSRLDSVECDHTLRHARYFIRNHELSEDGIVSWLENHGGYCDCEVVMNAEQVMEEAVPGYDDLPSAE